MEIICLCKDIDRCREFELVDTHELTEDCNLDNCHVVIISAVRTDIRLADYDATVNSIAFHLGLPANIRQSLLKKKYCSRGFKEMMTFHFQKGVKIVHMAVSLQGRILMET